MRMQPLTLNFSPAGSSLALHYVPRFSADSCLGPPPLVFFLAKISCNFRVLSSQCPLDASNAQLIDGL